MDKATLRHNMMLQRGLLSKHDVAAMSQQIAATLRFEIQHIVIKSIHVYKSNAAWNEVQTSTVTQYIRTFLPDAELTVGPISQNATLPTKQFDVIIVPLLAFDTRLHRLGFGGGWYDRFLANQQGALTIGLAYEFQMVPSVPIESHDIPLKMVITEKTTYRR